MRLWSVVYDCSMIWYQDNNHRSWVEKWKILWNSTCCPTQLDYYHRQKIRNKYVKIFVAPSSIIKCLLNLVSSSSWELLFTNTLMLMFLIIFDIWHLYNLFDVGCVETNYHFIDSRKSCTIQYKRLTHCFEFLAFHF